VRHGAQLGRNLSAIYRKPDERRLIRTRRLPFVSLILGGAFLGKRLCEMDTPAGKALDGLAVGRSSVVGRETLHGQTGGRTAVQKTLHTGP